MKKTKTYRRPQHASFNVGRRVGGAAKAFVGARMAANGAYLFNLGGRLPIRTVAKGNVPGLIKRGAVLAGRFSRKDIGMAVGAMALGGAATYGGLKYAGQGLKQLFGKAPRKFRGNQYVKIASTNSEKTSLAAAQLRSARGRKQMSRGMYRSSSRRRR